MSGLHHGFSQRVFKNILNFYMMSFFIKRWCAVFSSFVYIWDLFLSCEISMGAVSPTRNQSVMALNPIKSSHCFLEQEILPSLLSTALFLDSIRALFHNQTKINWEPYGRLTLMPNRLPCLILPEKLVSSLISSISLYYTGAI